MRRLMYHCIGPGAVAPRGLISGKSLQLFASNESREVTSNPSVCFG